MKKSNYVLHLCVMMLFATSLCAILSSCEDKEKDEPEQQLYLYPWVDHPKSYIKFFDYRMEFRMLNVKRNGSALQIDYTLTNAGFGREVSLSFCLSSDAGHDDLGNTYICKSDQSQSDVIATINGGTYSIYGQGKVVNFMPNQAIRGSFLIKNFDINANAFSISAHVNLVQPSGITLAYDRMDFVNIPVPK